MRLADVTQRVKGAKQLPALSATSQKILKMLGSANTSVPELSSAIAQDPPLAACILKLSNSVAYGGLETTKLPQAIMRIGLNMLRTLVLSNSVLRRVDNVGEVSELDRKGYWRYCLATGIAARAIAYRGKFEFADDAFLSGLLHGIGITVLDVFFPEDLRKALALMKAKNDTASAAVQAVTELTLGQIGAALIEDWQLGDRIAKVVASYDLPQVTDADPAVGKIVEFVQVGSALARAANLGKPLDGKPPLAGNVSKGWSIMDRNVETALKGCGIDADTFTKRTEDIKSDFRIFEGLA
ncbi:MAG: HDOD domain-containing protein [Planctomycetes bacterium]|nr:HDOD domain-containing protein [Planctomycetota bacterium]